MRASSSRSSPSGLRLYLYNFPALSGVAFTLPLVERLLAEFPNVVAGLKDSSGDAAYVAALHEAFPALDVFPSSEGGARGGAPQRATPAASPRR